MDLASQMVLFSKVVEEGSFSAAARGMRLTPSSLSRQIKQLEDVLSVRLLTRTGTGVTLTQDGTHFYERCRIVSDQVNAARSMLIEMSDHPTGRLKLASTVAFGKAELIPKLPEFSRQFPEVTIELILSDDIDKHISSLADVSIRFSEQLHEQSIIARKLVSNDRILVASPSYLKARGQPETSEALLGHDCLKLTTVASWNHWIPPGANVRFEGNSADAVYHATLAGFGIARLSSYLVAKDVAAGRLVRVLPDYLHSDSNIVVTYAERRNLPPKIRAFIDFMVEEFASNEGAEAGAAANLGRVPDMPDARAS